MATLRLHRLRLGQPTEKPGIQIALRTHPYVMADAARSNPFGTDDSFIVDFPIENKSNAKVAAPNCNTAEMMLADEIDRRLDRIQPQRPALLQCATAFIKEQPESRVFATKVIVDAMNPAGVRLLLLYKLPATDRTAPL